MAKKTEKGTVRKDSKGRVLPKGVSERSDGQYIWRFRYCGVDYTPIYDRDLARLKRTMVIEKAKILNGSRQDFEKRTLNHCFEEYIKQKTRISEVTRVNYMKYWDCYIRESLGNRVAKKLKKDDFVKQYKKLMERKEKPLAWGTVQYIHSIVFGCLEDLEENKQIPYNPARNALKNINREEPKGERPLTNEEEAAFFDYIDQHRFFKSHSPLFRTMCDLGLRAGEAGGLCWQAIHFEEGYIDICRALSYRDKDGSGKHVKYLSDPKTEKSIRTLPMTTEVRERLEHHLEIQKLRRRKCTEKIDGVSDFVYLTERGTAYTVDYMNQLLKRIVVSYNKMEEALAKEEKREPFYLEEFSSHTFRHTFGQKMKEAGASSEWLAEWLGHRDVRTTKIYASANWISLKTSMPFRKENDDVA